MISFRTACVRVHVYVNALTCFQSLGECAFYGAVTQNLLCDDLICSLSLLGCHNVNDGNVGRTWRTCFCFQHG